MDQAETLTGTTPINHDELALVRTNLSAELTMLDTLNYDIVELTPGDQLEDEIGRADDYSEKIQRTLLQVRKALKPPPPVDKPPDATPPRGSPADPTRSPEPPPHLPPDTGTSAIGVASSKVKLLKISLPHFKGSPIYWTAFWDSYESAVHLNSALSDRQVQLLAITVGEVCL